MNNFKPHFKLIEFLIHGAMFDMASVELTSMIKILKRMSIMTEKINLSKDQSKYHFGLVLEKKLMKN